MNYFAFLTLISIQFLASTWAMDLVNPVHKGPVKFLFRDDKNPARKETHLGNTENSYLHLNNVRIIRQFENGVRKPISCAVEILQADENVANGKWPVEKEALPSFLLKWETCSPPVETMDQLNNMQIKIQYQFFNAKIKGPVDSPLLTQTVNFSDFVDPMNWKKPSVVHYIFHGNVEVAIEHVQGRPHFYLTERSLPRGTAKFLLEIAGHENDKTIHISSRPNILFPPSKEYVDRGSFENGCYTLISSSNTGFTVNWGECEQYVLGPEDLRLLSIQFAYSGGNDQQSEGGFAKIKKTAKNIYDRYYGVEKTGIDVTVENVYNGENHHQADQGRFAQLKKTAKNFFNQFYGEKTGTKLTMPLKNVSAEILDAIFDGGEIKIVYSPNDATVELEVVSVPEKKVHVYEPQEIGC